MRTGEVLRNTTLLSFARISQPLCSFALTIAIAALLGASGLGAYVFAISYYFTFQLVASLGLRSLVTREVAREHRAF